MSESENQHRDQRALRHLVQIDAGGKVFALPIAEKTGLATDRPRVLIFPAAGGCTIVPGLTIAALLTPMPDEQGVARMAAVYDRLRKLELDVGGEGLPIDMLEAAVREVEGLVHDIRPDLANWDKSIKATEGELAECSRIVVDTLRLEDAPFFGQAIEHVRRLATMFQDKLAEMQAIAERVGPVIGEGQIAEYDRKPGELARAVRTLAERYVELREGATQAQAQAQAQAQVESAGDPPEQALRAMIEEWQGREPDPARSTVQLLAEVLSQADRWRVDADHYRGDSITANEALEPVQLELAQLTGENASLRADLAEREAALTTATAELARIRMDADANAKKYRAEVAARVDAVPGVLRIHWPEGVSLRAMVAPGTSSEDQQAVHEMIATAIGDQQLEFMVDNEPGAPPEGWAVWPGTRPGDPGEGWLYGVGDHDDQDSLQDADAIGREDTEADAIDRTWELAAEDHGDQPGEDD